MTGEETISVLKRCLKVATRLTGNEHGSLGLHPAVYFYTERGKHSRFLFLGTLKALSDHVRNNNKDWFKKFTKARGSIEALLVSRKPLINQGLANVSNKKRIDRVAKLINDLVIAFNSEKPLDNALIVTSLGLKGDPSTFQALDFPKDFPPEVKSAVFLQNALSTATKCPICGGLLSVTQSVSYDHVLARSKGGNGEITNAQLTHPYCNQSIKGDN